MHRLARLAIVGVLALPIAGVQPVAANHDGSPTHMTFQRGDVFVGIGDGKVAWYLPDGTLNKILDTGATGSEMTGMAFDVGGNLYATAFQNNRVYKFDTHGELIGTFGSGYNCRPESITLDAEGNLFIGQADCGRDVLKFSPSGTLLQSFDVATEDRGSDWIDLHSDQCTLRYTSEGATVKQFDVCANAQLPDFATGLPLRAFALRSLPDDRVLVATWPDVRLLSTTGTTERTFDASGVSRWFAMNLDPDGESFWSADYDGGEVYRFDLDTGQVISTFTSTTGAAAGLAVFGELSLGGIRDCDSENLSGAFGEIVADSAAGERVTVRYDGRFLVDDTAGVGPAEALAMAEKVKQRAELALSTYGGPLGNPGGLGFDAPDAVTIHVRCDTVFGRDAEVLGTDAVNVRTDFVRAELAAAAAAGFPANDPNLPWDVAGADWKNLVDHEMFHTIQYETSNVWGDVVLGHHLLVEAPAVLAQDLFVETDDLALLEESRSYLDEVQDFHEALPKPHLDVVDAENAPAYDAGGVMQYLAERYGDQGQANLEQRAAAFLRQLIGRAGLGQMDAVKDTIGRDPLPALRDYLVAAYGLRSGNISATENAAFAILDAETDHGDPAGQGGGPSGGYPTLVPNGDLDLRPAFTDSTTIQLGSFQGELFEIPLPPDTTDVHVVIQREGVFLPYVEPRMAALFAPIGDDNRIAIDEELMPEGTAIIDKTIPTAGRSTLIVALAGRTVVSDASTEYRIEVTRSTGVRNVEFLYPTANEDHTIRSPAEAPIELEIVPTIAGALADGLAESSFKLLIDNTHEVSISSISFSDGVYHLMARAPTALAPGTYTMILEWNNETFAVPGDLVVDAASPPPTQPIVASTFGDLGQGDTASATVVVSDGSTAAEFRATWTGSDFDLTLTAPSGRIISEASTDPDVTVTETATSVAISIDAPEPGEWSLEVLGVDVPGGPEPVDYEAAESGSPIFAQLFTADGGEAGLPIELVYALTDPAGGVPEATVRATITDPAGTSRTWRLLDDGTNGDSGSNDGVYGASLWATDLAGTYVVEVAAAGSAADGSTLQRYARAELNLGPKVDGDGDGVADAAELRLGLDPADPTDASVDRDADGLSLAEELAAGTQHQNPDSDGGGEHDGSELAAGRDPRVPGDDASFPAILIGASATDGRLVDVEARSEGGAGSIRLVRSAGDGTRTELGVFSGVGAAITDGPLAVGTYHYLAYAVSSDGSESAPSVYGPVIAAEDVIAPDFNVHINGGRWESTITEVSVTFTDLSETPADMRLALSEEALTSAAWQPFSGFTTIQLPAEARSHVVFAQIRDAAGNESRVARGFVILVDRTSPDSAAGPLDSQYSVDTISVPYTASDDLSGISALELWWRHRPDEASQWSAWTLGPTGTTSPLTFLFSSGAGVYEFYAVAIDGAGNREEPPAVADATTEYAPALVEAEVTKTFSFASGLDGWTGSGTNCTTQHVSGDGVPAGSLGTTVTGKNKTATCLWRSPLVSWQALGVPVGATVTDVRLESAATRLAICSSCQAGSINGYRLQSGAGDLIAALWSGRPLPMVPESWQTTAAQADQPIPTAWQPASSQLRVVLDATLRTGNAGNSTVTLRQDEVTLVITYQPSSCGQAPSVAAQVSIQSGRPPMSSIVGNGSATSSACTVAVDYRIQQYSWETCQYTLVQDWTPASPADGAFDETAEDFDFSRGVLPTVYIDHYLVDVRATAGGQSTTEQYAVSANPGQGSC